MVASVFTHFLIFHKKLHKNPTIILKWYDMVVSLVLSEFGAISLQTDGLGDCSGWHSVRRHHHEIRFCSDSFSGYLNTATLLKTSS